MECRECRPPHLAVSRLKQLPTFRTPRGTRPNPPVTCRTARRAPARPPPARPRNPAAKRARGAALRSYQHRRPAMTSIARSKSRRLVNHQTAPRRRAPRLALERLEDRRLLAAPVTADDSYAVDWDQPFSVTAPG